MNTLSKSRWSKLLPLVTAICGIGAFIVLQKTRPKPQTTPPKTYALPVEYIDIKPTTHQIQIHAQGTVVPAQKISLIMQVPGRIEWKHPNLVPGGLVRQGQILVRLDARDYDTRIAQQKALVSQRSVALAEEQARQHVAQQEWQHAQNPQMKASQSARLALRQPHVHSAKLAFQAAQRSLEQAQLDKGRTQFRAPFNAIIEEQQIDIGQWATPQSPLGTLVGTDYYWVQASLPVAQLQWFPKLLQGTQLPATIQQNIGNRHTTFKGTVLELLGSVDPLGHMARLLIRVDDPRMQQMARTSLNAKETIPLLLNSFVQVVLPGLQMQHVWVLPESTLRRNQKLFIATPKNTLKIVAVDVLQRTHDNRIIIKALEKKSQRIITTPIGRVVDGMPLEPRRGKPSAS